MNRTALVLFALAGLASTAEARHLESRDMGRVAALAHRLEEASEHVYGSARAYLPRWGYSRGEARILDRLDDLKDAADRFHREVERNYRDPRRSEDEFRRLVQAYDRAEDSLADLQRYRGHVAQDFERVRELMAAVIDSYQGYGHYGVVEHVGGYGRERSPHGPCPPRSW